MAILLSDISAEILNILQKAPSYSGFYTQDKVTRAVNECIAYVSARMHMEGEGWLQTIGYISTVAGTASYDLPTGCSIIHSVRYLYNDIYVPLVYDDQAMDTQVSGTAQLQLAPWRYRILQDKLYFNPIPTYVGTNTVQIEYTTYPDLLVNQSDALISQFSRGLYYYLVYRSAGMLVGQTGNAQPEWGGYEAQWYSVMENIVSKRLRVECTIKEFGGGW